GANCCFFFFQAEDGIRDLIVTGVQTCALPISAKSLASNTSTYLGRVQSYLRYLPQGRNREHPIANDLVIQFRESQITKITYGKRSEEHTSELQSRSDLVCRLLLEKKKKKKKKR